MKDTPFSMRGNGGTNVRKGIALIFILGMGVGGFLQNAARGAVRDAGYLPQPVLSAAVACAGTKPLAVISWAPVNGAVRYTLYRKPLHHPTWTAIATNHIATSYVDSSLPSSVNTYQYQLQASDTRRLSKSQIQNAEIASCAASPAPANTASPLGRITSGTASVAFGIDGVNAVDTIKVPANNQATAATSTPTPAAVPVTALADSANLIKNPSLEIAGVNGNPERWFRGGWGANTRTYAYPTSGINGKAAKVEITSYTNGDAKWYFENVPVTPGKTYTLSHAYKANVTTQLLAVFQTPGGLQYHRINTLPPAATWTTSTAAITIPANVTAITLFHLLFSVGTLEIDHYSLSPKSTSTPPISAPAPAPPSYYVMLNAITWGYNPLQNLPLKDISEATYFTLPVDAAGNLLGSNPALEKKFVADVKAKSKKATLSVAGGAQNVAHITSAVTTNKTAFINNIAAHITQFGYDGVVLDIENTNLPSHVLPEFIRQLRAKIGPAPIIGVYVQHWQIDTVHARLQEAADAVTWVAPMIYDFKYTLDELKSLTLAWLPKVNGNKSKLLAGVAVNYETGLNVAQYKQVLEWVSKENLGGVGVWQNTLYTQPWIDAQRAVWPVIK